MTAFAVVGGHCTDNSTAGKGQAQQDEDSGEEYEQPWKKQKTIKKVSFSCYNWWYYYRDKCTWIKKAFAVEGGSTGKTGSRGGHKQQEKDRGRQQQRSVQPEQQHEEENQHDKRLQRLENIVQQHQQQLNALQAKLEIIQLMVESFQQQRPTDAYEIFPIDNNEDTTIAIQDGKTTTDSINTQDSPNNLQDYDNLDVWIPLFLQRQRTNDNETTRIHIHLNTDINDIPKAMKDNHSNAFKYSQRPLQYFHATAIIVPFQGDKSNPHWALTNATNHYYSTALETG